MPIHNPDITSVFTEIADRLEIQGANPFRIRAYRNAARILADLPQEARLLIEKGDDLTRLPGIGDDLAAKINEIVTTGRCGLLERLRRELPPAITELMKIPGLGPKRVRALYLSLDVQTVEQLHRAAQDGRISAVPGFGEKTEQNILQAVEAHASQSRRFKLATAAQYAEALRVFLQAIPHRRPRHAARHGAGGQGAGAGIPGHHRTLAPPHGGARPGPGATGAAV